MHTWFRCVARYEKQAENGMNVKVSEPYLVDAISYTEAEARFIAELSPFISGDFTISDIKRANYSEIFEDPTGNHWFECKLQFITLDEKSGAEKKTSTRILVQAGDLREAVANLDKGMKGTMVDYVIASVKETPIMDIFEYNVEEKADSAVAESAVPEAASDVSFLYDPDKADVGNIIPASNTIDDKSPYPE